MALPAVGWALQHQSFGGKKSLIGLPTGQYNGSIFLNEVHFFQVLLSVWGRKQTTNTGMAEFLVWLFNAQFAGAQPNRMSDWQSTHLRICISSLLPGNADTAGPCTPTVRRLPSSAPQRRKCKLKFSEEVMDLQLVDSVCSHPHTF